MSKNLDPRFDACIEQAAEFARPILCHLRTLVHKACPDATETMKWSSPTYMYRDRILCSMAAFKAHCSFGFWHQEMEKLIARECGKDAQASGLQGRITSLADLPDDTTMTRYIQHAAKLNESDAPARPRPAAKPKASLAVPADLVAALKKNKTAAATFEKFSPSHRREYIEWIVEAKRDETRQKRLATTLEWLAEGKSRNWKYQNC